MKLLTVVVFAVLLAGCSQTRTWRNPEFSGLPKGERAAKFHKANGYCQMMAESGGPTAQVVPTLGDGMDSGFVRGWNMGQGFGASGRADRIYCACMESLGWYQVED